MTMTDSPAPASPTTITGLAYRSTPGAEALLDLYLPASRTPDAPLPLLVYLHGGAWIMGRRDETPDRLARIAEEVVAVASIDYTPVQAAPYPAQLDDILDALRWLAAHASDYGIDPSRTVLGGASAGGHLALLSGLRLTDPSEPTPELPDGVRLTGLLSMFASLDLTAGKPLVDPARGLRPPAMIAEATPPAFFEGRHPSPRERAALLVGVTEDELVEELLAAHSPVHRVHPAAPSTLLVHGTADAIASAEHSTRFAEAADAQGVDAEVLLVEGANHEGPEFGSDEVARRIGAFVRGERDAR